MEGVEGFYIVVVSPVGTLPTGAGQGYRECLHTLHFLHFTHGLADRPSTASVTAAARPAPAHRPVVGTGDGSPSPGNAHRLARTRARAYRKTPTGRSQ